MSSRQIQEVIRRRSGGPPSMRGLRLVASGGLILFAALMAARADSPSPDSSSSGRELSPLAARALEAKFQALSRPQPNPSGSLPSLVITDVEANSYLKFRGQEFLPRGVYDPEIHIHSNRIAGSAAVDFRELNQGQTQDDSWAATLFATMFRGRQRVSAVGRLATTNGQGTLKIQNVTLGKTEVPQVIVDWLLQNYVQARYNVDVSKPFALPDHITHIELGSSRATLHRGVKKKP